MTIVYFSNFINHHQANLSDELYQLTKYNYTFVELCPIYDWLLKVGYSDLSSRPYVIQAWKNKDNYNKALELLYSCDVALFGGPESLKYEVLRAKTGKLTFDVGERWLKRGIINLASPRLLRYFWYYYTTFAHQRVYKLCASAFACRDHYILHSYKNKCFKWGYFTHVDENYEVEALENDVSTSEYTPIMWCARFLKWKHPELPILMAAKLKAKGYNFTLDMFGSGIELDASKKLVKKLNLDDVITFRGNLPNEEILKAMQQHKIFLFTSDKNEGWGAVSNEAMSNGCVLVGSDEIGSIPFLVNDGENGIIFRSKDVNSLTEKVEILLKDRIKMNRIAINGYKTIRDIWSPKNAAKNLIQLINEIQDKKELSIIDGPCSRATKI